jgi:protein Tex
MLNIEEQLSRELNINRNQVDGTLQLLKEGDTVPFIARYRKEKTGNLNEIQIRDVWNKYQYYLELEARRDAILKSIREQGKLSPELEKKILSTRNKTELEDLYLPYRPKRKTRASRAREAGLEPLARWIFTLDDSPSSLKQEAAAYLNPKAGIKTAEQALRGAGDILAEEFSEDAEVRKFLRRLAEKEGIFSSSVKSKFKREKTKFNMYYDYREPVSQIPPHRILAMFRGGAGKTLAVKAGYSGEHGS